MSAPKTATSDKQSAAEKFKNFFKKPATSSRRRFNFGRHKTGIEDADAGHKGPYANPYLHRPEDESPKAHEDTTDSNKEALAKQVRRVRSEPNYNGLFVKWVSGGRPTTSGKGKQIMSKNASEVGLARTSDPDTSAGPTTGEAHAIPTTGSGELLAAENGTASPPAATGATTNTTTTTTALSNKNLNHALSSQVVAYRRTYSSNSIKKGPAQKGPDSFEKIKLIGKGDVGRVYLVRDKETGKLYALKVLDKDEMIRRNKIKRTVTEQIILVDMNHPFIVTLHHSFQSHQHLYLCMEYCSGGEFFRALQSRPGKCIPEDAARFYIAEVISALEYLHLKGLIYRDLKPENILLHHTGHIMLSDFDLSKISGQDGMPTMIVGRNGTATMLDTRSCMEGYRTNSFVGTEEYIAPEVIKGHGHSVSVDWWTVGILNFEMIYGVTPFKGKTRNATFANVLREDVHFPDEPELSPMGKSFIRKCLTKDEHRRIGARAGAAELKLHPWFRSIQWALLRHMKPPIIPAQGPEGANFRSLKESNSVDIGGSARKSIAEEPLEVDPFSAFSSVTLHYDGDER